MNSHTPFQTTSLPYVPPSGAAPDPWMAYFADAVAERLYARLAPLLTGAPAAAGDDDEDRWLVTREVAALLGVSTGTVSTIARQGRLHYQRVGDRYRFRRGDVLAYLRGERPGR